MLIGKPETGNFEATKTEDQESNENIGRKSPDFFYSKSLGKYISYGPLKVDERIINATKRLGITLDWDDEGRVNNVSFIEARRIAQELGSTLLSPKEFWVVYQEVLKSNDVEILSQLQSSEFTEWLDVVYEKDAGGRVWMIEHPDIEEAPGGLKISGQRFLVGMLEGRPGWFDPKGNIDTETGLPLSLQEKRGKEPGVWKYWSTFKVAEPVSGIRGYVTSSGTPSFDLDIPLEAKQPVLMIRESRQDLVESSIQPELIEQVEQFIELYLSTTIDTQALDTEFEHENFYARKEEVLTFLNMHGTEIIKSTDLEARKIKERIVDILGILRIMAKTKGEEITVMEIDRVANKIFGVEQKDVSFESFTEFIGLSRQRLRKALDTGKKIIFVMGHRNPDTDTVVSSLAEAYRNHLIDKSGTLHIPIVQADRLPDEVRRLLGYDISGAVLLDSEEDYLTASNTGQVRWMLVDHNKSDIQKFVVSITDHHALSKVAKNQDTVKTWEMVGSSTGQIVQKFHGIGVDVDKELARVLYGATLMDTENRSPSKMSYKDRLLMDDLKTISKIDSDDQFFRDLMSYLLNTEDADLLFERDYKQDWGVFGFVVAKVKGVFNSRGGVVKRGLLENLCEKARQNNKNKNFPLTIVKLVDYQDNNENVNRERMYLIFSNFVSPEFKAVMFELVEKIVRREFGHEVKIKIIENAVDFWGLGRQLSRKATAPFIEPVVEVFNEYYYSPSTDLYIGREFLKDDENVKRVAEELGIELSVDNKGIVNNITYTNAKRLIERLGLTMMSLSEYWVARSEADKNNDEQIQGHLISPGFVEFLDTVILDKKIIIDHPKQKVSESEVEYEGKRGRADIVEAAPGLIDPDNIDMKTGLPRTVLDPRIYGNKKLWRYWSPDAEVCIPTRGHIFLLNQPALDMKIHPDDSLPNLGIRPCTRLFVPPKVEITVNGRQLDVKITKVTDKEPSNN